MLTLKPLSLADANAFVAEHHRHHKPVRGHKFSLGCMMEGRLAGVAIVGRPVSRYLDDGLTLEVNACVRTARKMLAASFMARRQGWRKQWATKKLSLTFWIQRAEQASVRQAGNVRGWQAARNGPASAVLPSRFIRRK